MMTHLRRQLLNFVPLVSGLLLWEALVRVWKIPSYLLPAPTEVLWTLIQQWSHYLSASLTTLGEALAGLLLGVGAGIAVAVLITFHTRWERGVLTLAILLKATPLVAIAPLLTIWLGFGVGSKVIITAILIFFPVLINVHTGLHAVDEALWAYFHSLDAGAGETFRYLRWPTAMPYLFTALKIVAPLSLIGAVVAEWAGASAGLGRAMWLAYTDLNLPALFAAVFCSAGMGIILYTWVMWLERRVIFW